MAGNTFGTFFRITTFGESHGKAVGVILDGVKPNLRISENEIQAGLDRRKPGQSNITTPRREGDKVEILSGVFAGKTLGTPICMVIWNKNQDSKSYDAIKNLFRPGHAGFTYFAKYGIQDYRGGGRASGRETAGRVAAGSFAKSILAKRGIHIIAYTTEIGGIKATKFDAAEIEKNPVRCPDQIAAKKMQIKILRAQKESNSVGGIIEATVKNCPAGLGDPVFDKLDADLAKALMSIPAVKGFEVGTGFPSAKLKGSEHNDEFYKDRKTGRIRTKTNHAGGILGGISNGEDIVVRVAVKPTSSIRISQMTVDVEGKKRKIKVEGRHDPCICPRIVPVVESMIALVLIDHLIRQKIIKRPTSIKRIREEIDILDDSIMLLLSRRQELAQDIGKRKRKQRLRYFDPEREIEVINKRLAKASESNLDATFVNKLFTMIVDYAREAQKKP